MELTLEQCLWSYRNRFDIEHYFRFGKQRLLMSDFQTPDFQHQDNWMEIVGLAYWLLWVASKEAKPCVRKWQKYDPRYENRLRYNLPPTPSEVQRQLASIILGFEQAPFVPKGQIKSEGRKKVRIPEALTPLFRKVLTPQFRSIAPPLWKTFRSIAPLNFRGDSCLIRRSSPLIKSSDNGQNQAYGPD